MILEEFFTCEVLSNGNHLYIVTTWTLLSDHVNSRGTTIDPSKLDLCLDLYRLPFFSEKNWYSTAAGTAAAGPELTLFKGTKFSELIFCLFNRLADWSIGQFSWRRKKGKLYILTVLNHSTFLLRWAQNKLLCALIHSICGVLSGNCIVWQMNYSKYWRGNFRVLNFVQWSLSGAGTCSPGALLCSVDSFTCPDFFHLFIPHWGSATWMGCLLQLLASTLMTENSAVALDIE